MEKLIELLNEYENRDDDKQIEWIIGEGDKGENGKVRGIVNDVYMGWVSELVVYSAYYGFIKWLVENEKIMVIDKEIGTSEEDYICGTKYRLFKECYSDYEILLMLLSISDTPIEDLLLYLK